MPYLVLVFAFLGLGLLACTGRTHRTASPAGGPVAFVTVPHDDYVAFDPDVLAAVWPAIRRFELNPTTFRVRVGQDYPLRTLRVLAVDSTGARIGQIADLEYTLTSDVARLTPERTLRGMKVGAATLTLRPRLTPALEPFVPLPEWQVPIVVDPPVKE